MGKLLIRVSPKASRNLVELREGVVRVYVTTAPTDGQANAAVIELLAKKLGIATSHLTIVRGETSREKLIDVEGISDTEIAAKLG
ncbi:COG1872 Uncharacterized conserved protein [Fimbriimonadaceae bacterium]